MMFMYDIPNVTDPRAIDSIDRLRESVGKPIVTVYTFRYREEQLVAGDRSIVILESVQYVHSGDDDPLLPGFQMYVNGWIGIGVRANFTSEGVIPSRSFSGEPRKMLFFASDAGIVPYTDDYIDPSVVHPPEHRKASAYTMSWEDWIKCPAYTQYIIEKDPMDEVFDRYFDDFDDWK